MLALSLSTLVGLSPYIVSTVNADALHVPLSTRQTTAERSLEDYGHIAAGLRHKYGFDPVDSEASTSRRRSSAKWDRRAENGVSLINFVCLPLDSTI